MDSFNFSSKLCWPVYVFTKLVDMLCPSICDYIFVAVVYEDARSDSLLELSLPLEVVPRFLVISARSDFLRGLRSGP